MSAWGLYCPSCHRLASRSTWPLQAWWCRRCDLWTLINPFQLYTSQR